jgi:hypothetical protein
MRIFPSSVVATPRGFVCATASIVAAACVAIGLAVALPIASAPANGEALLARADFNLMFADLNAGSPPQEFRKPATTINFDQAFIAIAAPQVDNTPSNREKLRNAGWRRILQKS